MKKGIRQEKGVTLISLGIAIIILGIIATMLLYNIKDTKDVTDLTKLYSDIDNLKNHISSFYSKYGKIPAKQMEGLDEIITANWTENDDAPIGVNDTGRFLVIDLSALQGLTLNYGWKYEEIKNSTTITESQTDIYVINEASHNIFYLKGVMVGEHTYYTNQEKDTAKVNLRYYDGIKIFDGYSYYSGNKETGLIIVNDSNAAEKYKWIDLEKGNYTLSNDGTYVTYNGNETTNIELLFPQTNTDFINSTKQYGGFYLKQQDSGYVLYFPIEDENWSLVYDTESIYKDKNGEIAYIPAGFRVSKLSGQNAINKGLLIKNETTGQKYVWIDVPDKILKNVTGTTNIENALINYVNTYRDDSNYADVWYNGCGIVSNEQYRIVKKNVLDSIKNKGGFWISANENGNNITLPDARTTANSINNGTGVNTDLLFGIQWDLACKFIKDNADGDATKLNINNFDTENYEWTLEFAKTGNAQDATSLNSIARAGSTTIANHTAYNYLNRSTSLAYRVMIY